MVAQVAGSLVLLVVASLALRGLSRAIRVSPGFDAGRILTAEVTLDANRFPPSEERRYVEEAIHRVGALPGVESVSAAAVAVPATFLSIGTTIELEGPSPAHRPVNENPVAPGYFRTMGIRILRGRDFLPSDRSGSAPVAIVNQAFARRFFPAAEALGRRVRTGERQTLEIVAVAGDSAYTMVGEAPQPVLYRPLAQDHGLGVVLHVRTELAPSTLTAAVRRELASLRNDIPIRVTTMTERIDQSLVTSRAIATLSAITGGLGMLLALIGLYGLISQSVTRRTAEIGVRIALGATPQAVLRGVLREGLTLVGWGVVVGLLVALVVVQPVAMALFGGGRAADPLGLIAPAVLLLLAGMAASYIPARRATRIEPATALRHE